MWYLFHVSCQLSFSQRMLSIFNRCHSTFSFPSSTSVEALSDFVNIMWGMLHMLMLIQLYIIGAVTDFMIVTPSLPARYLYSYLESWSSSPSQKWSKYKRFGLLDVFRIMELTFVIFVQIICLGRSYCQIALQTEPLWASMTYKGIHKGVQRSV